MNLWWWCCCALMVPIVPAIIFAAIGSTATRLAALQLASNLTVALLMCLSFALNQSSSVDLALTLALLSLGGTLAYALFEERWV